jgi:hypothetical protein
MECYQRARKMLITKKANKTQLSNGETQQVDAPFTFPLKDDAKTNNHTTIRALIKNVLFHFSEGRMQ